MKEKFIKDIQKFLNSPFKYSDLFKLLDKQKDFLLQEKILEKTEQSEYNALWDTVLDLEKYFEYAKDDSMTIGATISITKIFEHNFKERNKRM